MARRSIRRWAKDVYKRQVQMVLHDGALGGNAGQDALAAAAKAAHQVVYGAADDDDLAARAQRVYPNLRTAGGGADKNEIVRHAIMIGNGKACLLYTSRCV